MFDTTGSRVDHGYEYQRQYAMLLAIRHLLDNDFVKITYEGLEDIDVYENESSFIRYQVKFESRIGNNFTFSNLTKGPPNEENAKKNSILYIFNSFIDQTKGLVVTNLSLGKELRKELDSFKSGVLNQESKAFIDKICKFLEIDETSESFISRWKTFDILENQPDSLTPIIKEKIIEYCQTLGWNPNSTQVDEIFNEIHKLFRPSITKETITKRTIHKNELREIIHNLNKKARGLPEFIDNNIIADFRNITSKIPFQSFQDFLDEKSILLNKAKSLVPGIKISTQMPEGTSGFLKISNNDAFQNMMYQLYRTGNDIELDSSVVNAIGFTFGTKNQYEFNKELQITDKIIFSPHFQDVIIIDETDGNLSKAKIRSYVKEGEVNFTIFLGNDNIKMEIVPKSNKSSVIIEFNPINVSIQEYEEIIRFMEIVSKPYWALYWNKKAIFRVKAETDEKFEETFQKDRNYLNQLKKAQILFDSLLKIKVPSSNDHYFLTILNDLINKRTVQNLPFSFDIEVEIPVSCFHLPSVSPKFLINGYKLYFPDIEIYKLFRDYTTLPLNFELEADKYFIEWFESIENETGCRIRLDSDKSNVKGKFIEISNSNSLSLELISWENIPIKPKDN